MSCKFPKTLIEKCDKHFGFTEIYTTIISITLYSQEIEILFNAHPDDDDGNVLNIDLPSFGEMISKLSTSDQISIISELPVLFNILENPNQELKNWCDLQSI
jgi:hypothetical protein